MADTVNLDELNCPACPDEPLMDSFGCDTDEISDGVMIVCPGCGFHVGAATAALAEAAVRQLQFGAWREIADG